MKSTTDRKFSIFLLISIFEGLVVTGVLLFIPGDPKNAFLFGYSINRLILLVAALVILVALAVVLIDQRLRRQIDQWVSSSTRLARIMPWVGGLVAVLLWLTVFMPAYRFMELAASFSRTQPLLILIELIVVQFSLLVWASRGTEPSKSTIFELGTSRRHFLAGLLLFLAGAIVFLLLTVIKKDFSGNQLYFPPGAPLSSLQVMVVWVIFLLLLIISRNARIGKKWHRVIPVILFFAIWIISFLTWLSVPLACTDDRPGPYPPNNICYPHVNDAVYSIGSHYITLGQGVNNHWLTDKPLYMAFLALGQVLAGSGIDDYLTVQVVVVALMPALLFIAGRKKYGSVFGLLLAALFTIQGVNSLLLYRMAGSIHVKLENPEMLTGLALLGFSVAVFKWLNNPADLKWAILSGGSLSLATLLRFNPVFIAPLLLVILLLENRKRFRYLVVPGLVFMLAFGLVFGPWFFSATDPQGNNYYIKKIEEVISSRFGSNRNSKPIYKNISIAGTKQEDEPDVLTYNVGDIDKAGLEGVGFHFLNNLYGGLAKLPTSFFFYPLEDQVSNGIWDFSKSEPMWRKKLNIETLLALSVNLVLLLVGVFAAWKKFGFAGLTGVIVQTGYYVGNAVSQTSGGRYLVPVNWITLVYYSLGILVLTKLLIKAFTKRDQSAEAAGEVQPLVSHKPVLSRRSVLVLLGGCLLIGLVLPALDLIPSTLPAEDDTLVVGEAYEILSDRGLVTDAEWKEFLMNPGHVVVQGVAYHPRYYRGDFYRAGNLSFELTVLAKEHVFIGYSTSIEPRERFSDGSKVILVGCRIGKDSLWAADRIIVDLITVIQLDKEGELLVGDPLDLACKP